MSSSLKRSARPKRLATVVLSITLTLFPWLGHGTQVSAQAPASGLRASGRETPEAADLSFTTATLRSGGVTIEWRSSDKSNLGFNIYRLEAGQPRRLNGQIIGGAIFFGSKHVSQQSEYSYSWFDPSGTADSSYYLESASLSGRLTLHKSIIAVSNTSQRKSSRNSGSLASNRVAPPEDEIDERSQTGFPASLQQLKSPAGILDDQWAVVAQSALKIYIKRDDWYRVTQEQMAATGFNPATDISKLSLFVDGRELAIRTNKSNGPLGPGDYIEFYARAVDTPTTDTRVYYLIAGTVAGKRLGNEPSDISPVDMRAMSSNALPANAQPWLGGLFRFLNGADASSQTPATRTVAEPPLRVASSSASIEPVGGVGPYITNSSNAAVERQAETVGPGTDAAEVDLAATKNPNPIEGASAPSPVKKNNRRKKRKNDRAPKTRQNHAVLGPAFAAPSFGYTLQLKERYRNDAAAFNPVYYTALLNGDVENYFGRVIGGAPVVQKLSASNIEYAAPEPASLEVALQGVLGQFFNHTVNVEVNGTQVATLNFGPVDHLVQTVNVPATLLVNGVNTVTFKKASSGDICLVDYLRLTYPHSYRADKPPGRIGAETNLRKNASLRFYLDSAASVNVDGFQAPSILLLDITDPANLKASHPLVTPSGSWYSIAVPTDPTSSGVRTFYALQDGRFETPAAFSLNQPSTLNSATNSADMVIVAHKSLIASAAPLVSLRQSQGMSVSAVDIEDVYDEFSYGAHGPQAIKDFLLRAKSSWASPPKYVIFLGDASLDPRSYEAIGDFDLVPTKLVDATYNETASDDWLTDFDNDGIFDIPSGRLPVRTPAEAALAISKIVNFLPANVPQSALMVADDHTNPPYYFNFEQASDELAVFLPASITVQKVYRRLQPSICVARANIINAMNQGVAVVNYSGHGNVNVWAGNCPDPLPGNPGHSLPMFQTTDAQGLQNTNRLPLVIVTNCLNGYFQDPRLEGIAEGFIKAQSGGAVAVFASSGETIPDGQHEMSKKLYSLIYGGQSIALGDAIKTAKGFTFDIDVRRTWIFFGDPSMKIR